MKKSLAIVTTMSLLLLSVPSVNAAGMTTVADYMDRMEESLTSGQTHEIQFTPATAVSGGAGNNVVRIEFPTDDDTLWCRTAGALTTSVAGLRNSATALPGTLTATCAQTDDVITITGVDDLSAGTLYAFILSDNVGELGTPTTATDGVISVVTNNGSSDVDTGRLAIDILTDDQVVVTGRILPTLTFAISDNNVGFGDILPTAVRYATADEVGAAAEPGAGEATELTVSTNADDGVIIEVRDLNGAAASGFYSADNGTTLPSTASSSVVAGTESYGVYGKNASSLTLDEGFDNDTTSDVAISTTYQTFAESTVPVDGGTVDVSFIVGINSTTPAGDYEDTLTFLATGRF